MPVLQRLNPQLAIHYGTEKPKFNDEPVDLTNGEFENVPHLVVQYGKYTQSPIHPICALRLRLSE